MALDWCPTIGSFGVNCEEEEKKKRRKEELRLDAQAANQKACPSRDYELVDFMALVLRRSNRYPYR